MTYKTVFITKACRKLVYFSNCQGWRRICYCYFEAANFWIVMSSVPHPSLRDWLQPYLHANQEGEQMTSGISLPLHGDWEPSPRQGNWVRFAPKVTKESEGGAVLRLPARSGTSSLHSGFARPPDNMMGFRSIWLFPLLWSQAELVGCSRVPGVHVFLGDMMVSFIWSNYRGPSDNQNVSTLGIALLEPTLAFVFDGVCQLMTNLSPKSVPVTPLWQSPWMPISTY